MLLEETTDHPTPGKARPIVVQKYGGSSVADVERLGRVADRVVQTHAEGNDVVVVVSAMGKSTDALLKLAREVSGVSEPPRRELDMLVSTGERVAMSLLSIAIKARGREAISFTGSQCGIITNDRHFDARIIEVRPHRIEDELVRGRIVIVAGYQGVSYRREITTLGRGGSDTTAVALAAALGADRCEIYSDVDGIYSADPRVVPAAQHLQSVDYDTLEEMAHAGAKVLNPQAVEWARKSGIAIHARSSFETGNANPRETVVRRDAAGEARGVRAVSVDRQVVLIELAGPESDARLLSWLETAQIPVLALAASADSAKVVLSLISTPDWSAARSELLSLAKVRVTESLAFVSIVGPSLGSDPTSLTLFRRALSSLERPPSLVDLTPLRFSALVDGALADPAQRALHAALVVPA
ncbi:MAG: aspartate kinase [Myxococcales bacterium]|nr:aspartate kinase [Myxococcales bacterium]